MSEIMQSTASSEIPKVKTLSKSGHSLLLASERQYFESIPWCAALIRQPGTAMFTPLPRIADDDPHNVPPTQDQFMRRTMRTDDTIPMCVGIYPDPFVDTSVTQSQLASTSSVVAGALVNSCSTFYNLQPGITGFSGVVHGGMVMVLLDDAMGSLLHLNHMVAQRAKAEGRLPPGIVSLGDLNFFTAGMSTKFIKPMRAPQVVMITASLVKLEGRKMVVRAVIKGEKNKEYATGEGLFIAVPMTKL